MNNENTSISLELLLLNDLLHTKAIDKNIYDQALRKILSAEENFTINNQPAALATA